MQGQLQNKHSLQMRDSSRAYIALQIQEWHTHRSVMQLLQDETLSIIWRPICCTQIFSHRNIYTANWFAKLTACQMQHWEHSAHQCPSAQEELLTPNPGHYTCCARRHHSLLLDTAEVFVDILLRHWWWMSHVHSHQHACLFVQVPVMAEHS